MAARARRLYPRGGCLGLEPADVQVLLALYLSSPQTVCRLAEALALSQPSVSHSLRRLAARSLVRAGVDASDTRRRPQAITRGGERLAARFLRLRRSAG